MSKHATVSADQSRARLLDASDAVVDKLSRGGGLAVALGVVAILGLLVMPVAQGIMDLLIGMNIAIAAVILLVSLYISDATKFPAFPTILLLTTLYRLALNVSSTRLILSEADGGEIIAAFGNFVVGGNYIVGGVIFLILTLIQFIVISKGSERVAEVSARFTLDAMAGKQMAIDCDLRGGLITPDAAKVRRRALDSESKLYGAMDGAMKFVKGDAIAGIVISVMNVVAGLLIGMIQFGYSAAESAQVFTLLAIGDGLVSQIPALLISTAAGIVVTRVASHQDGESTQAGQDIVRQILAHPSALACVALVLVVFGLIPGTGLPTGVFLSLAGILGILSVPRIILARTSSISSSMTVTTTSSGPSDTFVETALGRSLTIPTAIILELGSGLLESLNPPEDAVHHRVKNRLSEIQNLLAHEMGIAYPPIALTPGPALADNEYRILIFECPVARGKCSPNHLLLSLPETEAKKLGFDGKETVDPITGRPACWIPVSQHSASQEAGLQSIGSNALVFKHIEAVLRRHAADFLGVQETQLLLEGMGDSYVDLKEAVVPRPLSLPQLSGILQQLVREQIPLRDMRTILETLARLAPNLKHPLDLVEGVRRGLSRTLWKCCTRGGEVLSYHRLDADIEQLIESCRKVGQEGPIVAIEPEARQAILDAVIECHHRMPTSVERFVILTRHDLRPFVRILLAPVVPDVFVLSELELPAQNNLRLNLIGEIKLPLPVPSTAEEQQHISPQDFIMDPPAVLQALA